MKSGRSYIVTYSALVGLAVAMMFTRGAASLGLAAIQAACFSLVFLGLRHGRQLYRAIFLTGLAFFVLLLSICFIDAVTRETVQPQIPRGTGLR